MNLPDPLIDAIVEQLTEDAEGGEEVGATREALGQRELARIHRTDAEHRRDLLAQIAKAREVNA